MTSQATSQPQRRAIAHLWALSLLWIIAASFPALAWAQSEPTLPPSQRVTINLAAGMPGQSPWLYIKDSDSTAYADPSYNDSGWMPVGLPYSANLLTSFLNADSGGGDGDLNGNSNWYRLHFTLAPQYANSKVLVEFEGAHVGAQVYINGTLLPGISAVAANAQASHVVGFIPFIVDLTPYVKADGTTENVLAVRVCRSATWFEDPGFSEDYRFGQADAGLFRPVRMFITNKVHIPVNVYSNQATWGTYVATVSEVPSSSGTASAQSAVVEVQTNVLNETATTQPVTLTTQIVDANGNVVASASPVTENVSPMTPGTFPSGPAPMFDQQITIDNPTLWYPNNSIYGKPYLYHVYHIVSVNGTVVDDTESTLGIRIITWDHNFPYFNGHPMYLWGASGRYDYPALGSSVPAEQQWRDLAMLAAAGGNLWRPGHSTTSAEFVSAADEYGIMIDQPSGDGEGSFASPTVDQFTLKEELHRDMIVRDRSHPSILDWESNNGTMAESVGKALLAIDQEWDPIHTRVAADRTPDPVNGTMLGCTLEGCEVGVKEQYPDNPAWGAEYWGNGHARGLAPDYDVAFIAPFLDNWRKGRQANAFGMAQWYFADSPGEDSLYAEYAGDSAMQSMVRSLGASMVDMNRYPKLLYYAYQAAWTPFSLNPVVHIAGNWNRSGTVQVDTFSNCPQVRLLLNGAQQGNDEVPNPWYSDSSSNLTQTTTLLPFESSWSVNWAAGTLQAECLDDLGNVVASDTEITAGAEAAIRLSVVPDVVKPDGSSFALTANGSDAAFIEAAVVDANGNVVPTAADTLTFSVSGPATYMGGSEQLVSTNSDAYSLAHSELNYHAPGDPQLQVEGGLTKIALRSQFTPGTVTVTATAPGLASGSATYTIQPIPSLTPPPSSPDIIVPPQNTAVTAGQAATFTATVAGTAPLSFQWERDGLVISGATFGSYTTPATTTADNNSTYAVAVSNNLGTVTSAAATLTVQAPQAVSINAPPASVTVYAGQTAQFSVSATGSPTVTYQWLKNGAAIAGATGASYTTPVLTTADSGESFAVAVTNPVNSVTSNAATLTVNAAVAPAITEQPASLEVPLNNSASFSVTVFGSTPIDYQWQFNGSNIMGATAATYTISAVQGSDAGNYTVVASNAGGSVTSAPATLSIQPPGVNLALDQPATASSSQGAGLTPNEVNDGDLTTRWSSAWGVDPSWVEIDLGSVLPFDNVVLHWEAAYATVYQIQYSSDNTTWYTAYSNNNGAGGVENLTFPTVQGRYVRMFGQQRATAYGYSLYEMEVYEEAQCGGSTERYTVLSPTAVLDNISGLTWQRAETTYASGGAQYTQSIAASYCSSVNMRLPSESEALAISGSASASCAFAPIWNTWTSTIDPNNTSDAAFITSTGQASWQVADNYPGAVLCNSGPSTPPPTITTQPVSQTVIGGDAASFSVVAGGAGPFKYQWYKNGTPITGAYADGYTTPPTIAGDNGSQFYVVVTGPTAETVTSNTVTLTVNSSISANPNFVLGINAGGAATSPWVADTDFSGGGTYAVNATIDTTNVTYPAPQAVYQTERQGAATYTIPGLTAGASYTVRLHFAELYFTTAGQREFNVAINGTQVLTNFDIVATAGGADIAIVEPFSTTANSSGQIVIAFGNGAADQPLINGIEIDSSSGCTAPAAASGLAATAASSSQINLSWTASTSSGVTYAVYRSTTSGFTPSASNQIASGVSGATYSDTGLTASTTYYYLVEAADSCGSSAASNQASATTSAASGGGSAVIEINSGGAAVSGTNWVADEDNSGGGTYSVTAAINTANVTNPAPQAVYQTERQGAETYTIPGLTAGASYTVRLHFAELYWTAAGQREFNVSINGTQVLTNFDIVAVAGGADIAVVEPFSATANSSGQIVIAFSNGAADQPLINGIEIDSASGCSTPAPASALSATAASSSQINLSWTASSTSGATYSVFRSTTSGFTPSSSNQIASGVSGTSYSDTGLTASTAYYYLVEAVDSCGSAAASNQASATTTASGGGAAVVEINAGGAAVSGTGWVADTDYSGGGTYSTTNTIDTSAVTNPAPQAVYQTERQGTVTYTIPNLTAGANYTVTLDFAELYFGSSGQREFNVTINGTQVLTNFDIVATAGAKDKAVAESFTATANSSGQIVIQFSNGAVDQPLINGIEVQ